MMLACETCAIPTGIDDPGYNGDRIFSLSPHRTLTGIDDPGYKSDRIVLLSPHRSPFSSH